VNHPAGKIFARSHLHKVPFQVRKQSQHSHLSMWFHPILSLLQQDGSFLKKESCLPGSITQEIYINAKEEVSNLESANEILSLRSRFVMVYILHN